MKLTKIWNNDVKSSDQYLDFKGYFKTINNDRVVLNISSDNAFTIYLNKEIVGFGNCSNFKKRKLYYTFNLTKYIKDDNELLITVWHQGEDTQTYINQDAYLMFNVVQNKKVLLESNKDIDVRINSNYKQGYNSIITTQLGFSFYYDNTIVNNNSYEKAIEYGLDKIEKTGIKNLKLLKRKNTAIKETENGYIIDMKKETVGFLDLDIISNKDQELLISYGEHLVDKHVPRIIGSRDFKLEVKLKKGDNIYLNTFRRIAGRYLEIYTKDITINYFGIRPVDYPTKNIKNEFNDKLLNKIYDVSVYTLKCCMHEHYEDCPWREQGLYTMDSRNQMLCGYYAFKGYEFQKASLIMIANSLRKDDLLSICAPGGIDYPIPFFSLVYPLQVYEYLKYTNDYSILKQVSKTLKTIMERFDNLVDENYLIKSLPYPYWNFYEWNSESSNEIELSYKDNSNYKERYELILNAMYVYVHSFYDKIFDINTNLEKTKDAIKKVFYNENTGLYKLSTLIDKPSILGNSLVTLIGLGNEEITEKMKSGKGFVPITLSMNTFFYDALLKINKNNKEWILNNIKEKYSYMLKKHATTFWETEKGYKDFDNAGSLCHGWSAMPVYYFNKLINNK